MIAKLTGRLDDSGADWAVIEVGGVGYLVHCSARTLASLGGTGDDATLFTELQVSDSDLRLIGFATAGEREWFRLLGAIQGVGSKVALAILSALSIDELQRACAGGDAAMVTRAQGVGRKLASRIVNELRERAGALPAAASGSAPPPPPGTVAGDASSALQNLGFKPAVAAAAVSHAQAELGDDAALDDLVRVALRRATA